MRFISQVLTCIVLATSVPVAEARGVFDVIRTTSQLVQRETRSSPQGRNLESEEAISLYRADQLQRTFGACQDVFPDGRAPSRTIVPTSLKPIELCSDGFAVLYSGKTKTPVVTVEKLNRSMLSAAKGEERTDQFYADPRLTQNERAELEDYRASGFDRGHLAPAGDRHNSTSMAQSFALSNMMPQDPQNNRKIWNKIESDVRKFATRSGGDVFVYTGPLFKGSIETLGDNRVWVPSHLFKLVYDQSSRRAWAYILPNNDQARIDKPMAYAEFAKATGLRLLEGLPVSGTVR